MSSSIERDISVSDGITGNTSFSFDGIAGEIHFSDLYYEGSVIQFEQVEVSGAQMDANGKFFMWRKRNPVIFTISVFPGSPTDITLGNLVTASLDQTGYMAEIKSGIIEYSSGLRMEFSNGTISSGMLGANANGDNRMGPKTYRFVFEKMSSKRIL